MEEIDFLRRAHDQEIHDLQAMASRDTTSENREYFKNELAQAIREIREEYEQVQKIFLNLLWHKNGIKLFLGTLWEANIKICYVTFLRYGPHKTWG